MRAQEVCNMTVSDITFNSDKASIKVLEKGRKMRRIGIPAQASKNLSKYITYRKLSSNSFYGYLLICDFVLIKVFPF